MTTMGSLTLCRSLPKAGLVDRFRVVVFPVITASTGSDRIYDGYPDVALDMINSRTFDGHVQLLEYVPTVLDGPPGRMRPGHPVGLRGGRLRHGPTAVGLLEARSAQIGELPFLRVKGLRDPFGQAGHHDARSEGCLGTRVTSCRRPHSKRRRTCSLGRRR